MKLLRQKVGAYLTWQEIAQVFRSEPDMLPCPPRYGEVVPHSRQQQRSTPAFSFGHWGESEMALVCLSLTTASTEHVSMYFLAIFLSYIFYYKLLANVLYKAVFCY